MTAIGAVPAGGVTPPTAADIDAMTPIEVAAWSGDVQRWIVGPYTGSTPIAVLQWRALALVGYAAARAGVDVGVAAAGPAHGGVAARTGDEPHSPAGVVAANARVFDDGTVVTPLTEPTESPLGTGFAPGSTDDPAYSSPTPVAGDRAGDRVEPRDETALGEGQ